MQDHGLFSPRESILQYFNPTVGIDQGYIKPAFCCLPCRFARQKLTCCTINPRNLPWRQMFCGLCMSAALLHLDKNHLCTITGNQINFTRLPTPTPRTDQAPRAIVKLGNLLFGGKTRLIGYGPARRPHAPARRSAS